ncbi:MAG: AMP-binding protein, partial [Acidimicrobiales bacterium]
MYAAEHAARHPDRPAIIMEPGGETVTYGQYEARANQLAHFLRAQGLRRGDHIAILSRNCPEMLEVEAAAERTGCYFTLVNSYLASDEVAYIVDNCRARIFFAAAALAEVASAAAARCPGVERFVMLDGAPTDARWEGLETVAGHLPTTPVADEELGAAMLYSSGTTGRPKGILRALSVSTPAEAAASGGIQFLRRLFQFDEHMTYLNPAPLYH